MKYFYICSFGGCGSHMLKEKLKKYGKVEHIHSRYPPEKLEYIGFNGGGRTYVEWFNGIKIPENMLNDIYVIYLYRDPVKCILSRFDTEEHLMHIQTHPKITVNLVTNKMKDLYGLEHFYNNYTSKNEKRNYKIYCVKYEELFDKQNELSSVLNIGPLNLVKKETKKDTDNNIVVKLEKIYENLNKKMKENDFITVV